LNIHLKGFSSSSGNKGVNSRLLSLLMNLKFLQWK